MPGGPGLLRRVLEALPPASGSAVMSTGIVSVALELDRRDSLSTALMWIAAAIWIALALLLVLRLSFDRSRLIAEAAAPAALTGVAGVCVLGTRLTLRGWTWAGIVALLLGALLALALAAPILRHWRRPTVGASFLVTVAAQALAVLGASLAIAADAPGLVVLALVLLVAGLAGYAWVLRDFDLGQLLTGRGDHWVSGGAMAISALAGGRIVLAIDATGGLAGLRSVMDGVAVVLALAALAWLPPLVIGELIRPRLRFSALRWATVFPVGMYAAAAFTVGAASRDRWMTSFAQAWVWVALAVWAAAAAGAVVRGTRLVLHPVPGTCAGPAS